MPEGNHNVHDNGALGVAGIMLDKQTCSAYEAGFLSADTISEDCSLSGAREWLMSCFDTDQKTPKMALSLWYEGGKPQELMPYSLGGTSITLVPKAN